MNLCSVTKDSAKKWNNMSGVDKAKYSADNNYESQRAAFNASNAGKVGKAGKASKASKAGKAKVARPYDLFSKKQRPIVKSEFPDLTTQMVNRKIGENVAS